MKSTKRPVKKQTSPSVSATWWIIGLIAVMAALALIVLMGTSKSPAIDPTLASGNTLGDPNAPITVDEFADFQCPLCGQFALQVLPQIEEKYIKTGKVKWVFNHFTVVGDYSPLAASGQDESRRAAEAAECANDQGKFWEYANILFTNQAGENQGAFNDANLEKFAQQLGLNMEQFKACMADRRHLSEIENSNNYAKSKGISGTPTLFINGVMVNGSTFANFEKALLPYLNSAR